MKKILSGLLCLSLVLAVLPLLAISTIATESRYLWPCPSSIKLSRGYTSDHKALDIIVSNGSSVLATKSGTVVIAYNDCKNFNGASDKGVGCDVKGCPNKDYYRYKKKNFCHNAMGNGVVIDHGDGTYSQYNHLSKVYVKKGQYVSQGQEIGKSGSTGASTGPHLHFALTKKIRKDPFDNNKDVINYIYDYTAVSAGHNHSFVAKVTSPTCTSGGYTTYTCSSCKNSYVDDYKAALGHNWSSSTITKSPTTTSEGIRTYSCSRCSRTKTEIIPRKDYTEFKNPNISEEFIDVSSSGWYTDAIDFVYYRNLMSGVGQSRFSPNGNMSRAMLVTVLWRIEGTPTPSSESPFKDLFADWYKDAVAWANEKGIVKGTTSSTFSPDTSVTREQIAAILYRYASFIGDKVTEKGDLKAFPDSREISEYAIDAVSWAVSNGIISGNKIGDLLYISPTYSATRASVATMLMRFLKNSTSRNIKAFRYDLFRVQCDCGKTFNDFDSTFLLHLRKDHDMIYGGNSADIASAVIKEVNETQQRAELFSKKSGVKAKYETAVIYTTRRVQCDCGKTFNDFDSTFLLHLRKDHDMIYGGNSADIASAVMNEVNETQQRVDLFSKKSGMNVKYETEIAYDSNSKAYTYKGEKWYSPNEAPRTCRLYD